MNGYLLDTNILGELRKGRQKADPDVYAWWLGMRCERLFLSVLVLGEIRKGIEMLRRRDPAQVQVLERWLAETQEVFGDRIFDVTQAVAMRWGAMRALRPIPEVDALLAATAIEHNLTMVTRNESDFADLGIRVLNPFNLPPRKTR